MLTESAPETLQLRVELPPVPMVSSEAWKEPITGSPMHDPEMQTCLAPQAVPSATNPLGTHWPGLAGPLGQEVVPVRHSWAGWQSVPT